MLLVTTIHACVCKEETFPVWIAHCRDWQGELQAKLGGAVRLAWLDPDVAACDEPAGELVYESPGFDAQ